MKNALPVRHPLISRLTLIPITVLLTLCTGSQCDQQPPRKATPPAKAAAPPAASRPATQRAGGVQVGSERTGGADDQDSPDAPRALPRSNQVGGWVKSQPIRVFTGDALASAPIDRDLAAVIAMYRPQRIATCQYQAGSNQANVTIVEAAPHDAFGIFTVMTAAPRPIFLPDGSTRGRRADNKLVSTAWQGETYVQVSRPAMSDETVAKRAQQLLDRIIFALPNAEPPLLTRIIPREQRERCRVWYMQDPVALRAIQIKTLAGAPADVLGERLGLGKDSAATLSVAAIDVLPDDPHLIWLAEYPTPEAAAAAHTRYTQAMKDAAVAMDASTMLEAPRGRFLAGTWSRQQEALKPILPLLVAALPEADALSSRPASAPGPAQTP